MKKIFLGLFCSYLVLFLFQNAQPSIPDKLSAYQFFKGDMKNLEPNDDLIPYDLNSPLFTDYSTKARFIKLPANAKIPYNADKVLSFPEGTILIKNFYYPMQSKNPAISKRIIETRLLIHESNGWKAYPYIWNEEQTDATLEITGGSIPVQFRDINNQLINFTYEVPNINQCKGCHEVNGKITPIGPSVRQLHKNYTYAHGENNQLLELKKRGILEISEEQFSNAPQLVGMEKMQEPLEKRAKSYLDGNCAHCHNPEGPAKNSGLNLRWDNTDKTTYGFMKSPVAAGRGSGNYQYDILPGKAKESILFYRMNSKDPGIMMPELGRKLIHQEGVELIREWIKEL